MPRKLSIQRRTRISPELDKALHEEALIQGLPDDVRSMNAIITQALEEYLDQMKAKRSEQTPRT